MKKNDYKNIAKLVLTAVNVFLLAYVCNDPKKSHENTVEKQKLKIETLDEKAYNAFAIQESIKKDYKKHLEIFMKTRQDSISKQK